MTTIIQGELPTTDFALGETFDAVPGFEFECVRLVENRLAVSLPLISARGPNRQRLEAAFDADPSVESFELLAAFEEEWLYRMDWSPSVNSTFQDLLGSDAAMLDAYADADSWRLRMLYPERDDISNSAQFFKQQGLSFDIHRVRNVDNDLFARNGLTEKQIDALVSAWRAGYFEVPRRIDLEDLAAQMGISHQALSERLRRGHSTLIEETIADSCQSYAGSLRGL